MNQYKVYRTSALVCCAVSALFLLFYVQGVWSVVDETAFAWAFAIRQEALTVFFQALTFLGTGYAMAPLAIITAIVMLRKGCRAEALVIVVTLLGAFLVNEGMKAYFARPRPEGLHLIALPGSYSYPSGHAMVGSAFYLILFDLIRFQLRHKNGARLLGIAGVVLALLLPVSRVYLGVHYASDVLSGFAWALTLYYFFRYGYGRWGKDKGTYASAPTIDARS